VILFNGVPFSLSKGASIERKRQEVRLKTRLGFAF